VDCVHFGYKNGFAVLYASVDDSNELIMSSNGTIVMSPTDKKRIVHRIPNDFSIADSARAAILLSQCSLSLK
jgi:non-ribosomal peptide synthetase component E (peptide arylation enzyme)